MVAIGLMNNNLLMMSKCRKFLIISFIVLIVLITYKDDFISWPSFTDTEFNLSILKRMSTDRITPKNGQNIFFTETGNSTENIVIDTRSACGVESAALTNPHMQIFVVFSSLERFEKLQSTPVLEALRKYPNVHIMHMNMTQLAMGSPMEEFIIKGEWLSKSWHKTTHTSDVLRLLLLWNYAGTYVDMDIIVQKPLDSVSPNYACPQSYYQMNGAILNFDTDHGRELVEVFMKMVMVAADNQDHGGYGPKIIGYAMTSLCNETDLIKAIPMKECKGFHIMDSYLCYEIFYQDWWKFAEEEFANEVMGRVQNSLVVHFWSSCWDNRTLDVNSEAAYIQLAREFCPKVLASCGDSF